jgi:hypothetical protein
MGSCGCGCSACGTGTGCGCSTGSCGSYSAGPDSEVFDYVPSFDGNLGDWDGSSSAGSVGGVPCSIPDGEAPCKPECAEWLRAYFSNMDALDSLPSEAEGSPEEDWLLGMAQHNCTQYERCCRGERVRRWPEWHPRGAAEVEEWRRAAAKADQEARDAAHKAKYERRCDSEVSPFSGQFECSKWWLDIGVPVGTNPQTGLENMCLNDSFAKIRGEYDKYKCLNTCAPGTGRRRLKGCKKYFYYPSVAAECDYWTLLDSSGRDPGRRKPPDPDDHPDADNPHPRPTGPVTDPSPTGPEPGREGPRPDPRQRDFDLRSDHRRGLRDEAAKLARWSRRMRGAGAVADINDLNGLVHFVHCVFDMSKVKVQCRCEYEEDLPRIEPAGGRRFAYAPAPPPASPPGPTTGGRGRSLGFYRCRSYKGEQACEPCAADDSSCTMTAAECALVCTNPAVAIGSGGSSLT